MFGAAMSYYMFTLAGGIPITLGWKDNEDTNEYDDSSFIDIQNGGESR